MAELVARRPWDGRIRHLRDAEYFAWRFRDPLHDYRFLYWDDGGLRGYPVLQRYVSDRADHGCVNIADVAAACWCSGWVSPPDQHWKLGGRDLLNIRDWDLRMLYSMVA
jgi:hypothetical protein